MMNRVIGLRIEDRRIYMKKTIIITLLSLVSLTIVAQDRLIRVDSESMAWRKDDPQMALNDREKMRLLMPQDAVFGVECIPSFSPEWMLTYDSIAHALVCKKAENSIWHSTYKAMHKKITKTKKDGKTITWKLRKHPKDYLAPEVKTYTLAITNQQALRLESLWADAVNQAEDREVNILDGIKWEFFVNDLRAKSHSEKNALVKFTNELVKAVRTGNVSRKDSLLSDSVMQKCKEDMNRVVKPKHKNKDSIVVITNGRTLPDSLCRLIHHRPKLFYYQQGELIDSMTIWSEIGAKTYLGIDCPVLQLKTVPDTLNDAYVSHHPEMQQVLRHVSGVVLDENDKPLADVWVGIYGMGAGSPTDSVGHFSFWMPRGDVRLYAECMGYQTLRDIQPTETPFTIRMKNLNVLREVKVESKNR